MSFFVPTGRRRARCCSKVLVPSYSRFACGGLVVGDLRSCDGGVYSRLYPRALAVFWDEFSRGALTIGCVFFFVGCSYLVWDEMLSSFFVSGVRVGRVCFRRVTICEIPVSVGGVGAFLGGLIVFSGGFLLLFRGLLVFFGGILVFKKFV